MQRRVIEGNAEALDVTSKQNLQVHSHELAKTAQMTFQRAAFRMIKSDPYSKPVMNPNLVDLLD